MALLSLYFKSETGIESKDIGWVDFPVDEVMLKHLNERLNEEETSPTAQYVNDERSDFDFDFDDDYEDLSFVNGICEQYEALTEEKKKLLISCF